MKKQTVKLVKGGSVVFVSISTHDSRGKQTDDDRLATGYTVDPGGCCALRHHPDANKAFGEFHARIGYLVANGYMTAPYKVKHISHLNIDVAI